MKIQLTATIILLFACNIKGMTKDKPINPLVIFEVFNATNQDIGLEYLETSKDREPFYNLLTIKRNTLQRSPNFKSTVINIMLLPISPQYMRVEAAPTIIKTDIGEKKITLVDISSVLKSVKFSPPSYEKIIDRAYFRGGRIWDEYRIKINAKGTNLEQSTLEIIYTALPRTDRALKANVSQDITP